MPEEGPSHVTSTVSRDSPPRSLESRLLAYVDILGSKERLATDIIGAVRAVGALNAVATLEKSRKDAFTNAGIAFGGTLHTSTFSDTIIFSCKPDADEAGVLLWNVQMLCVFLLSEGNYTRGAITFDGLVHHEATVVGRALVEAHALEQEIAKYPRIVLSDSATNFLTPTQISGAGPKGSSQLRYDFDGLPTLDIFGFTPDGTRSLKMHELARKAKEHVELDLAHTRDATRYPNQVVALNHRAKYAWMLAYLEEVLSAPVGNTGDAGINPNNWP